MSHIGAKARMKEGREEDDYSRNHELQHAPTVRAVVITVTITTSHPRYHNTVQHCIAHHIRTNTIYDTQIYIFTSTVCREVTILPIVSLVLLFFVYINISPYFTVIGLLHVVVSLF